MKLLFTCLVLLSIHCHGQTIPEGATSIQVRSSMADSLLFKETIKFLKGQGWVIARPDDKRNGFTTENRTLKTIWRMRLLVDAKNSVATFRTQWSSEVMGIEIEDDPVVYKGREKAVYKTAFRRMDELVQKFARDIPDADIRYIRQELAF